MVHWFDHGPTSLANCALLCRRHHRLVHQPGYRVRLDPDGALLITTPTGALSSSAPQLRQIVAALPRRAGP